MFFRYFGYCLASSVVVLALLGGGHYSAQEKRDILPKPKDEAQKAENTQKTESFFQFRSELAKRNNGVLLEAKVASVNDTIEIRWDVEYDGPRSPLNILEPSLDNPTQQQTKVCVYAVGRDGKVYEKRFLSPYSNPGPGPNGRFQKALTFLTLARGQTGTGTISLDTGVLKLYFRQLAPEQFEEGIPPPLHFQMTHEPTDRGDVRGNIIRIPLDAWTGTLHTKVILVPKMAKW